jgi:hypothetical protein
MRHADLEFPGVLFMLEETKLLFSKLRLHRLCQIPLVGQISLSAGFRQCRMRLNTQYERQWGLVNRRSLLEGALTFWMRMDNTP